MLAALGEGAWGWGEGAGGKKGSRRGEQYGDVGGGGT